MSHTLRATIVAAGLAVLTATSTYAGPYDALYVFGDSLSDVGNDLLITSNAVPASPPYFAGRFSNGPNYADVLANGLGLPLTGSTVGGTGYAYGGARSDYVRPELVPFGAKSYVEQIDAYKTSTSNVADPNGLYVLWIGSNDMGDVLTGKNPVSVANGVGAAIANTLGDLTTSIADLAGMGAKHFLIPNLPNLGLTPDVLALPPAVGAQVTGLTQAYNAALDSALNSFSSLNLFRYDTFSASTDVFNNPADHGLTNVTQGCYPGLEDGSLPQGGSICATPGTYLFWDHEHPSAALHAILGNQMLQTLAVPEPSEWVLFATGLGFLVWRLRRQERATTSYVHE